MPKPVPSNAIQPQQERESTKKKKRRRKRDSFGFDVRYSVQYPHGPARHGAPDRPIQPPCPSDSDSDIDPESMGTLLLSCKTKLDKKNAERRAADDDSKSTYREPPNLETISTYEEYLDYYITDRQLFYFDSEELARFVMSLKYSVPELLTRKEFDVKMKEIEKRRLGRGKNINIAQELEPSQIKSPLMQALAQREAANRTREMATIIYIRTLNSKKQEVSAWIDFQFRLERDEEKWVDFYTGKRRLIPSVWDLCYYNWTLYQVRFNSSENYVVKTDINMGLQFMNIDDEKLVTVNPLAKPGEGTEVVHIQDPQYMHVMIYDHTVRVAET